MILGQASADGLMRASRCGLRVVSMPSPVVSTLREWKKKQGMSPCGRPIGSSGPSPTEISLPIAQATSSTTGAPSVRAMHKIALISLGMPNLKAARRGRCRILRRRARRRGKNLRPGAAFRALASSRP